jgi:hypothetical protein
MKNLVAQPWAPYNDHPVAALRAPIRAGLHPVNADPKIIQGSCRQPAAWLPEATEATAT